MSYVAGRCEALCANCFSAIFSRETRFLSHPKVCSKIVLANNYSDLEVVELTPVYTYFEIYVIIVLSWSEKIPKVYILKNNRDDIRWRVIVTRTENSCKKIQSINKRISLYQRCLEGMYSIINVTWTTHFKAEAYLFSSLFSRMFWFSVKKKMLFLLHISPKNVLTCFSLAEFRTPLCDLCFLHAWPRFLIAKE